MGTFTAETFVSTASADGTFDDGKPWWVESYRIWGQGDTDSRTGILRRLQYLTSWALRNNNSGPFRRIMYSILFLNWFRSPLSPTQRGFWNSKKAMSVVATNAYAHLGSDLPFVSGASYAFTFLNPVCGETKHTVVNREGRTPL